MSLLYRAVRLDSESQSDASRGVIIRAAMQFARAGGVPTLSEWLELDELERAALISARARVDAETSVRTGMAAQGREGAARAMRPLDGGAALMRFRLERAVEAASTMGGSSA